MVCPTSAAGEVNDMNVKASTFIALCLLGGTYGYAPRAAAEFFDSAQALVEACKQYAAAPAVAAFPNINCYYDLHQHAGAIGGFAMIRFSLL